MNRLGKLFVAAAIAVVPTACKDDVRDADKAAENLQEAKEDLNEESKELKEAIEEQREDTAEHSEAAREAAEENRVAGLPENASKRLDESEIKRNAEEIADESEDVAEKTAKIVSAESDFELERNNRVHRLRAVHMVTASQPMLINTISQGTAFTDKARADLAEKMQVFQMRVDEAGNAIEALQTVEASNFEDYNNRAAQAMDRLEDAREDAWESLNDGDRIEPS